MADSNSVSAAEVEKFKLVRAAERKFITALMPLVKELGDVAGNESDDYRSMQRWLKARI